MKKEIKWESYEDAKKRIEKQEILKKLRDHNLSSDEKAKLMEKLYEGIDIKN